MAMVLLGTPVTAFAEDEVPVAQSVYIKATNVPELKVGEELPSLDDVQLEVTVFARGVDSPSTSVADVVLLKNGSVVTEGSVEANTSYSLRAVFFYDSSFTVDDSTTFASNLGANFAGVDSGLFSVVLPLGGAFPVVTVDVVDVPDLVVGQPFPELDLDKNFTVSVTPGFPVTSASVSFATWCTTSDWLAVDPDAVVQPGVSYGIGTTVVGGDGDLNGGPWVTAGVASSSAVGLVFAGASDSFAVGLVVGAVSVPVTGVSLSETTKTLTVGESFALTALVSPEDATNNTVFWESSDAAVASVSGDGLTGTVKALKAGTTTITVTTEDGGHEATCEVTVTEAAGSEPDSPTPPPGPDSPDTPDTPDNPDAPPVDRSSWGTPYVREADGVTQYVVEDPASPDYGMTSVEFVEASLSALPSGEFMFWIRESSGGSSAWYGLPANDISHLGPGYRFYVQWLSPGEPGYDALLAQLDDAAKQRIEDDNGWIFNMGIRAPDGEDIHYLITADGFLKKTSVYVQIGDDWDVNDLNAYYIAAGGDETVPVDYLMLDYPGGTDTFCRMTLEHFSPYIIFDELTDAEKATLGNGNPTTGDRAPQMAIAGLGIVLVLALGIMLRLITGKKKFEE